ncbi:MAG: tetraacyldisaccharide 4'-kinase, partial [Quisquiliibacterium sp.]
MIAGRLGSLGALLERAMLSLWFAPRASFLQRLAIAALSPLSWLTAAVARQKRVGIRRRPAKHRPAVVVVGNLLAGGTGKTPAVIAIANAMHSRGWQVGVLTRGYKAESTVARLVFPASDAKRDGDEPVLIADRTGLPVAAGNRRDEALKLLEQAHPQLGLVVSDDGLQHARLPRTVEIAVFDARGIGNGLLLPAGPLREPLELVSSADAILLRAGASLPQAVRAHCRREQPVFSFEVSARGFYRVAMAAAQAEPIAPAAFALDCDDKTIAAVAGIARPQRFFQTLRALGLRVREYPLPDHARIEPKWLEAIAEPVIVMTGKDAVKCRGFADARCWMLDV